MVIEFCCPECKATLAVDEKVAGGQVSCPKCTKKIFIPLKPPLERVEDKDPFDRSLMRSSAEVKTAIATSVEPYRIELSNKVKLLNDAVEMVKVRNQRIRDVETLMLGVQKDLWAIEVEFDERNHAFKRVQAERRELRQKLLTETAKEEEKAEEKTQIDLEKLEQEKHKLEEMSKRAEELERTQEEYAQRVTELETKQDEELKKIELLETERDQAQEKLAETQAQLDESEDSLGLRNEQLSEAVDNLEVLPVLSDFTAHLVADYLQQESIVADRGEVLDQAQGLLEQAGSILDGAETRIQTLQAANVELQRERDAQEQLAKQNLQAYEAREVMLKDQQRQLDEQKSQFDSVVGGKDESEKELQSLRTRLNRTQKELISKEERMQDALSAQQQQLERAIALEKIRSEQDSMLQAETQRADAAQRKIERTQKALEDLQRDHKANTAAFDEERGKLMRNLEVANANEAETHKQISTLQKDYEHLKKSLASQPDQLETMNPGMPISAGGGQLDALLEASKSEIVDLRGQVRMLEDKAKAGENLRAHDKSMTERLRTLEAEHQQSRDEKRKVDQDLVESKSLVEQLQADLEKAQHSAPKELDLFAQGDAAIADLLKELDETRAKVEAFDDVKWDLERKVKDFQNENSRLQNTVKTLSANLKAQWKRGVPTR